MQSGTFDRSRLVALCIPVIFVGLSGVLGFAASQDKQQPARDPRRPAQPSIYRVNSFAELEPKTADEKVQAWFFDTGLRKLSQTGDEVSMAPPEPGPMRAPLPPGYRISAADADAELRDKICGADAVFVGLTSGFQVRLTGRGMFLYTNYRIIPVATIKPMDLPGTISLSVQGGVADVAGKIVKALAFPLLSDGKHYLLFAKRIPNSTAYVPVGQYAEVPWPADKNLRARLEHTSRLAGECRSEPRS